ncbi:hypothetical protein [Spirochaeta dissipatitropha]
MDREGIIIMAVITNEDRFIRNVEDLIDPAEVCNLFFFQRFRKLMPNTLFRKLLVRTSRKTPYMGFVIEPYSLFLFFKLIDVDKARAMLPERFELIKASVFEGDEPDYYFGIGNLNTRGSTFWGVRLESYLIARDKETDIISWIFFDILSNTIIAIPSEGIVDPNSKNAIFTTNSKGDVYVDIKDDGSNKELVLKGNLQNGKLRKPDQPLWVMGNTSIAHVKNISARGDDPFAVIFDPSEVSAAMDLPVDDFVISRNTLVPDFADKNPVKIACFPYTQHYIADSPGCRTHVRNTDDLIFHYNRLAGMSSIKTFSTKSIRRLFLAGIVSSPIISLILLILLILK